MREYKIRSEIDGRLVFFLAVELDLHQSSEFEGGEVWQLF